MTSHSFWSTPVHSCIRLLAATIVYFSSGDLANAARPQPGQLASRVRRESDLHPGRSAIQPLPVGREPLAARIALIRAAEHTLEVQYCIWKKDAAGLISPQAHACRKPWREGAPDRGRL